MYQTQTVFKLSTFPSLLVACVMASVLFFGLVSAPFKSEAILIKITIPNV